MSTSSIAALVPAKEAQVTTLHHSSNNQSGLPSDAASQKINKSAKDFESILIGNWLQHAEETFARAPGSDEDDDEDATTQMQQGLVIQPLAEALTNSGGLGIAALIAKQLARDQNTSIQANSEQNKRSTDASEHLLKDADKGGVTLRRVKDED